MFKLESNRLKREFKITDGKFYASQIMNTCSGMSFVPDGNGGEFIIRFIDGEEYSSKGLPIADSRYEEDKLVFEFEENMGVRVTVKFWVHADGNTICKQIFLSQSNKREIDYVVLENVGIINSKTHLSVDVMEDSEISGYAASLGQPFYIDSLFFGCEFPATDNRIEHGTGRIKYFVGRSVGRQFACPVTVMGGGSDNTVVAVKTAFFEYIDFISCDADLRFQYNSWYDYMTDIDEKRLLDSFSEINKQLRSHSAPALSAFTVDDGWADMKAGFWTYNKKFPNGMKDIATLCKNMGAGFGMWLGPRGGYSRPEKFAKHIQKHGNGYVNKEGKEICVASADYVSKLQDFLIEQTQNYDIDYWKLDGFCQSPCRNEKHDHMVGGENDMYFLTDMWHKWIALFANLRRVKHDIWINMTCYTNVSPWWLQWVNSVWLQNSNDIGFSENIEEQPQVESEITYRDSRYFDCVCRRANQFPLKHIYNHEPIYGKCAKVSYSDEEFDKYIFWCTVRGQALNELHLSADMMNDYKWTSLSRAMNFQKENYHILKKASYIGGDPQDNNIYGYISWTQDGEGIIALRNPSDEKTSLTLTLNKLMGVPQTLSNALRRNVYCRSIPESDETLSYGDRLELTLHPFEMMIFKIIEQKED